MTIQMQEDDKPMVLRNRLLSCQVCVPATFTNGQAKDFVLHDNPSGTEGGWHMRKQGSENLSGCEERVPCEKRPGFVHIMFDC